MVQEMVPVGEMKDELARRRINKRLKGIASIVESMEEAQGGMSEAMIALTALQAAVNTANTNISSLNTSLNGKQNTIAPANAIASASTGITLTLLTQVAVSINSTNSKINEILLALRQTGIIRP